jgi:hypothetical protein
VVTVPSVPFDVDVDADVRMEMYTYLLQQCGRFDIYSPCSVWFESSTLKNEFAVRSETSRQ